MLKVISLYKLCSYPMTASGRFCWKSRFSGGLPIRCACCRSGCKPLQVAFRRFAERPCSGL